ncbi:lytic transglycosylase domain-containing protein [Paraburkholderia caledonica]|uniref:Transglycosylase SLT domain-containing protein n=1 Tax=Paraburkholderia caledonica TaxID=134536 RepID=A0AB73IP58_9BURK|nr:hypothetical protein [Paraburkholderia caledonica]
MTAKSVVDIEINDSQFRDFYSLFQEYQERLQESSSDWQSTTGSIGDAEGAMEKLLDLSGQHADAATIAAYQANVIVKEIRQASAANAALVAGVYKATKGQKGFSDEVVRGEKSFSKMAKHSKEVANSVFGIGKFLLKLGAIGGGIAGLGGLLSGLGLRDLASSAVDTQRSARGLGIKPGQYTAFNQDFGRYVDPSVLGTVADSQNSFIGRTWLARASGLTQEQVTSQGPDQLAAQLALKAHDWWANTPGAMRTAENLQTTGLPQSGFSLEMVRQQGNTPRAELERAYSQYQKDQKRFDVSDKDTDAWYGFLRQIKDAGNTIETSLKNKLVALAPDLQKFVDVIGKDAEKLITEIFTPKNLQSLGDGITELTNYLGSSKFKQDMRDFADLIGGAVDSLRKVGKFFNFSGVSSEPGKTSSILTTPPGSSPSDTEIMLGKTRHFLNTQRIEDQIRHLQDLDRKHGLPLGTLEGMWQKESSEGKNLVGPKLKNGDQAIGDFQFTSAAWKDWGKGGDRFSFNDEADAAARYMSSLSKRYGGDVRKALAGYNWGPGNVDKAGANWESRAPSETRDYVAQIGSRIAQLSAVIDRLRQSPQSIQITNSTSARVAVQANAAAIQ